MSGFSCWVHEVSTQMKNVIHSKSNEHDNCNGLIWSKLLTIPYHECHNGNNDDCYVEDGDQRSDYVSCNNHKNHKWEAHGDSDSLESSWKKSFFMYNIRPSFLWLYSSFQFWAVVFMVLVSEILVQFLDPCLPFFKDWLLYFCRSPLNHSCGGRNLHEFNLSISKHDKWLEFKSNKRIIQPCFNHRVECCWILNRECNCGLCLIHIWCDRLGSCSGDF